jgi:MoxR-like ATPase
VVVEPSIIEYIVKLVTATREHPAIEIGASPRSSVGLLVASRALAASLGRTFVVPDDIKQLVPWIFRHRIRLEPEAEIEGSTVEIVMQDLLESIEAPKA